RWRPRSTPAWTATRPGVPRSTPWTTRWAACFRREAAGVRSMVASLHSDRSMATMTATRAPTRGGAQRGEEDLAAQGEAELLVEPDPGGVHGGGVQEWHITALPDHRADRP